MTSTHKRSVNIALTVLVAAVFVALAGIEVRAVMLHTDGAIDADGFLYCTIEVATSFVIIAAIFLLELIFGFRFPIALEFAITVFFFVSLGLGGGMMFYETVPYWDKGLHTGAGVIFSILGYMTARAVIGDRLDGARKAVVYCMFGILITLAEGYLWELFEFMLDSITPIFNSQSWKEGLIEALPDSTYVVDSFRGSAISDTMGDMFANFIGALLTSFVFVPIFLKHPQSYALFDAKKRARPVKTCEDIPADMSDTAAELSDAEN